MWMRMQHNNNNNNNCQWKHETKTMHNERQTLTEIFSVYVFRASDSRSAPQVHSCTFEMASSCYERGARTSK